jgi:hypothetical protein
VGWRSSVSRFIQVGLAVQPAGGAARCREPSLCRLDHDDLPDDPLRMLLVHEVLANVVTSGVSLAKASICGC